MPLSYNDLANFYTCHLINSTPKPLNFKPDLEMGEGTPTPEEVEYRQALLDLANRLYKVVKGRFKTITNTQDLIRKIDNDINDFILEGQKVVLQYIPQSWNQSQEEGMSKLEKIGKSKQFDESKIDDNKRDLIIQQQQANVEDIGLRLRGRIRQYIYIKDVQDNKNVQTLLNSLTNATYPKSWTKCMIEEYKADPTLTEEELRNICEGTEWEDEFQDVQDNLDKVGLFGWVASHKAAMIATMAMGTSVLGSLVADWVTVGDDRVCEECQDLEANSPYSVLNWPESPHFGCRCSMENVRLEA